MKNTGEGSMALLISLVALASTAVAYTHTYFASNTRLDRVLDELKDIKSDQKEMKKSMNCIRGIAEDCQSFSQ